mmetsp:Transcript_120262/g.239356  ORF Transcript_120262/g.239356 Transcript_120262/m.239356 type:complete len:449 (-) Transcript_120262:66-1412(-)
MRNSELILSTGTYSGDACADGTSKKGREIVVDEGSLMVALELGFKEMEAGSRACLRISEEWGCGALTAEGNPNLRGAAIWAELLLHTVENEPGPGEHPTVAAALAFACTKKQQGNASLALNTQADYSRACRRYRAGMLVLEAVLPGKAGKAAPGAAALIATDDQIPGVQDVLKALRLNAAQAELKRSHWKEAVALCSEVLLSDPGNLKAHFRRGLAEAELGNLASAASDLRLVAATDRDARRELARIEALRQSFRAEEKSTFGGVFDKMRKSDEERERREQECQKAEELRKEQEKKEEQRRANEKRRAEEEERRRKKAEEEEAKKKILEEAVATGEGDAPVKPAQQQPPKQVASGVPFADGKPVDPEALSKQTPATPGETAASLTSGTMHGPLESLDQQLLKSVGSGPGDNSKLAMMPPPFESKVTDKAPPVDYQLPAFLRRGKKGKA